MADLDVTIRLSRPLPPGVIASMLPLPPADPVNLVFMPQAWTVLFLSFDDPGKSALNYELDHSTSPVFAPGTVTSQLLPANPIATTGHFIPGLNLALPVYIRIRALNGVGNSNYLAGTAIAPIPAAPQSFNGAALSTTSIILNWNDVSDWAITYDFEYAVMTLFIPGPFTAVSLPAAPGAGSHTVTGLTASTQYLFRIRAVNPLGVSAWVTRKISTP